MKKIIILVGMVFMYVMGSSQAISQRGTSAVTVQDARLFAQYNFRPPVFQDTTAANLNLGLDSCGALIFARNINGYYLRACNPKRWITIGGTSTGINGLNGTANIGLGGTLKSGITTIGGNADNTSQVTFEEGDGFINTFKVNATNVILQADNNLVILPADNTSSDSLIYKPLATDASGNTVRMESWVGGSQNLQQVTDIGATTTNTMSVQKIVGLTNIGVEDGNYIDYPIDYSNLYGGGFRIIDSSAFVVLQPPTIESYSYAANIQSYKIGIDGINSRPYINMDAGNSHTVNIDNTSIHFQGDSQNGLLRTETGNGNSELIFPNNATPKYIATSVNGNDANYIGDVTIPVGSVTSVATGYGLSGGTITTSGTLLVDSATLSAKYLRISDTATMLVPYAKNTALAVKLNISDTATMLNHYFNTNNFGISKSGQTISADTTTSGLSGKYLRIADTANKWVNNISRTIGTDSIIFNIGSTRYAIKDSVGTGGSGGGGSAVSYYLNGGTAASVATYYQMSNTAVVGTNADFSLAGNGLISQWLTDVGNPNQLQIAAGNWNFEIYMSASSSGGTPAFYVQLLKYDGSTFTSIASSSVVPENITGGTSTDLYLTSLAVPQTTLLATDRLAVRVYIVNSVGGRTITMHTQDSHLCQIVTNFTSGISALNGLTSTTQTFATGTSGTDFGISSSGNIHTFNLPTASATNRGALSSTNWTTFNNKVNIADTASMLTPYLRSNIASATYLAKSDSTIYYTKYRSDTSRTNIYAALAGKQGTITLTTTGTSGASTLVGSTLNIPQYSGGSSYTFSTGLTNTAGTVTSNLSTGVSGGQSVVGGTAASENLTLSSTSNATKGKLLFGTSAYDEVNNRLGIGTASPSYALDVSSTAKTGTIHYIAPAGAASSGSLRIGTTNAYPGSLTALEGDIVVQGNTTSNGTARIVLGGTGLYQDMIFAKTNAVSTISNWSFGSRYDAYFGNTSGSFQIVGQYTDNTFRVPIICNPNGNVIIAGASATAINGNVLIGTSTDAGYKFDVNGTGRFQGDLKTTSITGTGAIYTNGKGAFGSNSGFIYKLTNGGSNLNSFISGIYSSNSTASGTQVAYFDFANTALTFAVGNSSSSLIARTGIGIANLNNTAGSEAADLTFLTQSGGTAMSEKLRITSGGGITLTSTNTAAGTTGNQTINKPSGTVNIAAAGTTVTVTNSLVSATSIVFAVVRTNDGTATIKNVVPAAGSFVINLAAAATAETSIGFFVIN